MNYKEDGLLPTFRPEQPGYRLLCSWMGPSAIGKGGSSRDFHCSVSTCKYIVRHYLKVYHFANSGLEDCLILTIYCTSLFPGCATQFPPVMNCQSTLLRNESHIPLWQPAIPTPLMIASDTWFTYFCSISPIVQCGTIKSSV